MRWITHWATALITLSIISFIGWSDPFVKETLRLKSFDLIQQYDTPTQSQDIAIVEIDERAIQEYGQWPWKRTVIADLIWKLRDAGAGVIILPVLFSEQDRLGGDMDLAQALAGNGDTDGAHSTVSDEFKSLGGSGVYGFKLGQLYNHLRECYFNMDDLLYKIRENK